MPDLLIELFSEEIPARMQTRAAEDLRARVTNGLVEAGLTYAGAAGFATPRRLTLAVEGLSECSAPQREERKGPRVGAPEAALAGFERATGVPRDRLEVRRDKKAEVYFAVTTRPGRPAAEIVAEVVAGVVRGFSWPSSMRWGQGNLRWVRPLHAILCILTTEAGAEVVPLEIEGIAASDTTRGHRFMAPAPFKVASFEDYAENLARAFVVLDASARAERIWNDATQGAFALGLGVVPDPPLLAEIAGLVEWPVVLLGRIEPRFLDLPPEVLRSSMRLHQKFLSLRDPASGRIEGYVVIANRETADHGATILAGNAKVLAARLADAEFFWQNDLRTPLEDMAAKLSAVTFHGQLGSQADRVARIAALAREIAPAVGADPDLAERAAKLAKVDLASQMVYEFPELQGTMGRYYAERAGEDPAVAVAAQEHYAPLGPSEAVPTAPVPVAVALADKMDMLTAFWAIDEKPTGSKDPFALRRAALGVIRIILEGEVRVALNPLLEESLFETGLRAALVSGRAMRDAIESYIRETGRDRREVWVGEIARALIGPSTGPDAFIIDKAADLLTFFADRLKVHLRDQGIRHDVIDACFHLGGQDDLVLLVARVRALQEFLATEDGANLLAGYKRATNILEIEQRKDGVEYSLDPNPGLAQTDAERALFTALDQAEAAIAPALDAEDFAAAMTALARLRAPIDAFFDTTTVNAEAPMVRRNRLCLLDRIRSVMNRAADFARLEGG